MVIDPPTDSRASSAEGHCRLKGRRVMLESVSEQIRECYEHAEDCARKAAAQTDQGLRQDFLDMERRWLALAKSYELSDRLGDFKDTKQQAQSLANGNSEKSSNDEA
jgi:hypothetical protein